MTELPSPLVTYLKNEKILYSMKSKHGLNYKGANGLLLFSLSWIILMTFIMTYGVGWQSLKNINLFDSLFVMMPLMFVFIGVGLFIWALKGKLEPGAFFVFLNDRLVIYSKGTINTYMWNQFSNNIEMDIANKHLTLELMSGTVFSDDNSKKYVPGKLFISGVENVLELEKMVRTLIAKIHQLS